MVERRPWTRRNVLGGMVAVGSGGVAEAARRAYPMFDLEADFGAVGDGSHNNTGAFDAQGRHIPLSSNESERAAIATGIWLDRCTNVVVRDVRPHHHGLDERVTSDHNGRQGLSWIGGWA